MDIHIILCRTYITMDICMYDFVIIMYILYLVHNLCFEIFCLCGCWSRSGLGQSIFLNLYIVRVEEAILVGCFTNLFEWWFIFRYKGEW